MNVADKARVYAEARRVLVPGGRLAHWNDLTESTAALMQAVISSHAEPLGLHAFVPDFAAKAANLTRGLASGHLHAIQGVALAAS
jgi:hypothetical protein